MTTSAAPLQHVFTYKQDASAGDIPATVHYAPAASGGKRPIAILFHMGGFTVGAAAMVPAAEIAVLVRLGFVVVTPEYRLGPQVGLYEGPLADAKDSLVWSQDQLPALLEGVAPGVQADGTRVAVMGQSAGGGLALYCGGDEIARRPVAIVDFYGATNFSDPWWSMPLAAFAQMPDVPQAFIDKVYEGAVPVRTGPMFKDGKPDFADARNAWLITTLKRGTNMKLLIKDGNVARADPQQHFDAQFPPTWFVHGTKDVFIPDYLSAMAHAKLRQLGVRSHLEEVPDQPHVFDLQLKESDPLFQEKVLPALQFMAREAGLQV